MVEIAHKVDQFFTYLSLMELAQCDALISEMAASVAPETEEEWWTLYLRGVLLNERDRDWSSSERLFRELSQKPLSAALSVRVQNALANTYQYLGRWQDAVGRYQQILKAASVTNDKLEQAKILKNMAIAIEIGFSNGVFELGDLENAKEYCESALSLLGNYDQQEQPISWLISTIWNTYGLVLRSLQEWDKAISSFDEFLSISTKLGDYHSVAAAQQNLGEVYEQMGRFDVAEGLYEQALATYRTFDDRYMASDVQSNLGQLKFKLGQLDASLKATTGAIELSESIRARLSAPAAQMGYRSTVEKLYRTLVSIHLAQDDYVQAFTAAERARSRVLADLLLGQRPEVLSQVPANLVEKRNGLIRQITQFDSDQGCPSKLANLEQLLNDIDHQIELFDPNYALLDSVQSLDTQAVQQALPRDAVLLSYTIDSNDKIWAMVVTPSQIVAREVEKITATWLRSFLADHLDGVRRGAIVPDKAGYLSEPTLFPLLYKALIAPVEEQLLPAATVYLVPAGPLHYIPLGALMASVDAPPMLMTDRRLVYAPSATILLNFCRQRQASTQQGALIVAPADEQLKHTVSFAQQQNNTPNTKSLVDKMATRAAFLNHVAHHRVICFLGHAVFDQHHPMSSRLQLVDGDLRASEILREMTLDADLVILSACETGRNQILAGDEMLGLTRALFYAGTPSILTTLWPVHEIPTLLLVHKLLQAIELSRAGEAIWDPATYLSQAQLWLRNLTFGEAESLLSAHAVSDSSAAEALRSVWQMTTPRGAAQANAQPFRHPFFWAPYILVGE